MFSFAYRFDILRAGDATSSKLIFPNNINKLTKRMCK